MFMAMMTIATILVSDKSERYNKIFLFFNDGNDDSCCHITLIDDRRSGVDRPLGGE